MKAKTSSGARADTLAIFKLANSEWELGRNKRAFKLFLEAARLGQASAQHNVGYFYELGIGARRDGQKAMFWYKKAWKADRQTDTCINIAKLYASHENARGAVLWWKKAVNRGDGDAALDLAKFYLSRADGRHATEVIRLLRKVRSSRQVTADAREEAANLLRFIEA